jgi:TetR/AcrR family fatty acid metabolism transcriptional regulator
MRPTNRSSGLKRRSVIEDVRRAQIIESAVGTVAEHGYVQASLARIAERAGISKSVISYHFDGKDELLDQLVGQIYERITEFVVPHLDRETTVVGRLRARFRSIAAYASGHRAEMVALTEILTNLRDADGRLRYGDSFNEPYYQRLEETFRGGQESGELCSFDPRVMAVTVQAAIDSMIAYADTHPDHDIETHADELANLFERAISG